MERSPSPSRSPSPNRSPNFNKTRSSSHENRYQTTRSSSNHEINLTEKSDEIKDKNSNASTKEMELAGIIFKIEGTTATIKLLSGCEREVSNVPVSETLGKGDEISYKYNMTTSRCTYHETIKKITDLQKEDQNKNWEEVGKCRKTPYISDKAINHVYETHVLRGIILAKKILTAYDESTGIVAVFSSIKNMEQLRELGKLLSNKTLPWVYKDGKWVATYYGITIYGGADNTLDKNAPEHSITVQTFFPCNSHISRETLEKLISDYSECKNKSIFLEELERQFYLKK